MLSRKAARRSSRAVSTLTATTSKPLPPASACSLSSAGISARQGTHQVAHRFRSSARPRKSASAVLFPSARSKASGKAWRGSGAIVTAATSPLASGFSFAASAFEAAGQTPATLLAGASVPYRTAPATAAATMPSAARERSRRRGGSVVVILEPLGESHEQRDVGRPVRRRPGRNHGGDQRLDRR